MRIFKARTKDESFIDGTLQDNYSVVFVVRNEREAKEFLKEYGFKEYELAFIGTTLLFKSGSIILEGYEDD